MHRLRPAVTLVRRVGLPRQASPARLFAFHFALGVVGPENTLHGHDGGLEPLFAGPQRVFGPFALGNVNGRTDVARKGAVGAKTRLTFGQQPAVIARVAQDPKFMREGFSLRKRRQVGVDRRVPIIGVHQISPAKIEQLLYRSAR